MGQRGQIKPRHFFRSIFPLNHVAFITYHVFVFGVLPICPNYRIFVYICHILMDLDLGHRNQVLVLPGPCHCKYTYQDKSFMQQDFISISD